MVRRLWEQTLVAIWRAAAVIQSTRSFSKKCAGRCTTATPPIATKVGSHRIFGRPANQAPRCVRPILAQPRTLKIRPPYFHFPLSRIPHHDNAYLCTKTNFIKIEIVFG
jgi:hypothetical protein